MRNSHFSAPALVTILILIGMERWVGDKLHDILGISDKLIAQYLLGLASKSKSEDDFIDILELVFRKIPRFSAGYLEELSESLKKSY